jgi:hypothetical protein
MDANMETRSKKFFERDENQSVAACRVITCFAIREFEDLIRIVAEKIGIDLALIEKDGIMHCLYGLQRLGYKFELKCGTSLFKGFKFVRARRRWAHY